MLTGAIIGGLIGLFTVLISFFLKNQRFQKVSRSIGVPTPEYVALYHYASYKRYKKSFKFFDSYGVLYLVGKTVHYKTSETSTPIVFNLAECTVQQEEDWKRMKWFSITTPVGEKHYFNSHKMGAFVNNSEETLRGLAIIKAKQAS